MKKSLLSVVIADDDRLVLNDLVHMVDWAGLGFTIAGTALSGEQALKCVKKCHPNLLITDIRMIGMDGLDLIEEVHKLYPESKFLIISAYHEFDYARRAMASNVTDYLLKTDITPVTLTQKLLAVRSSLLSENASLSALRLKEFEQFFHDKEEFHLNSPGKYTHLSELSKEKYYFLVVAYAQMFTRDISTTLQQTQPRLETAYSMFYQLAMEHCASPILCIWNHKLIIGISGDIAPSYPSAPLKELLSHFIFKQTTSAMPFIYYYQDKRMTIEQFKAYFYPLDLLVFYHLFFYPPRPEPLKKMEGLHLIELNRSFSFHSLIFDEEHEENNILLIKNYVMECCSNYDICSLISFYQKFCTHMEISTNNALELPLNLHAQSPEYLLKWIFNTMHQCILYHKKGLSHSYSPVVESAIRFMQQNYSDFNLTAVDIADSVGLSSNRLGVLFKQDTGNTVNEYLNNYRVKKAVELLEKTNMKIYEISEKCGYKSSQYFSQIIYQKTGKRPIDYRKATKP